jgi:phosphoglycerate dehydrogenase-like enzyme
MRGNMNTVLKPKIICADHFYMTAEAMKVLEAVGDPLWPDAQSEDAFLTELSGARVVISEYVRITPRVLDASMDLRGVMVWGAGYDHVDVDAASERGIFVANTSGSNAESVAEQAFAFILALSRRLLRANAFVEGGGWTGLAEASLPSSLVGNDLAGKTLGIIGLGNIGRRVARIAHGFNMHILACDPYVPTEAAKRVGVDLASLHQVLEEADYVTLHTVLSAETRGLIGARELALMKPTAYLINTSRGAVVDQRALLEALDGRRIAGAALDVFDEEPLGTDSPLLQRDNVIVTPHYAGNAREALEATSMRVSEEVARMVRGEAPVSLVNRRRLEELGFLSAT